MKLKSYSYHQSKVNSWEDVFNNPFNIYLTTLKTGTVKINLKGTLNPDFALDIHDQEWEVPILFHWLRHQDRGDILLDTGIDASYITDPRGGLTGASVDEFELDIGENTGFQIEKNRIKPKLIFLSHLHSDHAAGIRDITENISVATGKGEYGEYLPEVHGDFLGGLEVLYEIDFSNAQEMPYLGLCVDLLGDNSLWAVWTPGHTPGHMSFLVNGVGGPVLLTMDAAFIQMNLDRRIAPVDYTWNVNRAQESLDKIVKFLVAYPQVRVGVGHELLE